MGSNEHLAPTEEVVLAPLSELETLSISLQNGEKAVKQPISEGEAAAAAAVECGVSLSELNFHSGKIASDLEPEMISLEDMGFSEGNRSSHALGDGGKYSQEPSFLGAARDVVEGGNSPLNNANLSVERNIKFVLDMSDADNGLHVDLHSSDMNALLDGSAERYEKRNSKHANVSLLGKDMENFGQEPDLLSVGHFDTCESVPSGRHTHVQEGSTSTTPPEHVEKLASFVNDLVSLQFCAPSMTVESGYSNNLLKHKAASRLNGLRHGNNSVAVADASCHADEEREGNADIGGDVKESNNALSSVRRSSRSNKYVHKPPKRTYTKKGAKKVSDRTIDLLPAAVRNKRSCLNRSPGASKWGLIEIQSKHIKQSSEAVDQGLGFVKNSRKGRKQNKVQVGTSSKDLKGGNRASSGHIRLKVKLGKEGNSIIMQRSPVGTASLAVPLTGSDNQPNLGNNIENATRECMQMSTQFSSSVVTSVKAATCLERTEEDVQPLDNDLEISHISSKSGAICGGNYTDKEVDTSEVSTEDRCMNSGTSPDSEVIQVPDSQFVYKALEVCHISEKHSCKATVIPSDDANPAKSQMRRRKTSKKGKLPPPVDNDMQDWPNPTILGQSVLSVEYCEDDTLSNVATMMDIGHKPAGSQNSEEPLPPTDALGNKKSKGFKAKGRAKNKMKPTNASRSDIDNSGRGKDDKWKLTSAYSISENDITDQVHGMKRNLEAGKPGMDECTNNTNVTSSGVTFEDVSSLPVIPGGVGQQIMLPRVAWVCCDDCLKWRCISAELADIIDETDCRWTCKDNKDKAFADCSVPQEKSNSEINTELNISDDEDGCDAHRGRKFYSMRHAAVPQESSWMLIKSNIFLHRSRKMQTLDEIMVCHCKPPREGKLGCGDECLNRMLSIECVQGTCPCGDLCSNQQFQKQNYANLKWFRCGKKGYGLQVLEDISEGQFLIEYVGEVLDVPTYEARQREYASKGHKHFYFMTLDGNEVIDACAKGNVGRFINHSCNPNCRTEKWMVNGEICIGLFAVRDIKKGEELTFDYKYVRVFGAAAMKCYCGSAQCRGYIGGDPLNTEVIVQGDSDEEFPEPVVIHEDGEIGNSLNITSKSNSLDVMEKQKEDTLLHEASGILSDDKEMVNKVEESVTYLQGQLPSIAEEDALPHSEVEISQLHSSLDVQQEKPINNRIGITSTSPKISDSFCLGRVTPEFLSDSCDTISDKSKSEMAGVTPVHSKARPRMKISRPSRSSKTNESSTSSTSIEKTLMIKRSQALSSKPKKLVDSSAKPRFETVEEKLNELLDSVGGIRKQKDAFKGYLKLLVLTAASSDGSHHESIQSNKDLSMILDAILKTKSRTVLTDIINKNGLQMLHSMMKKCRGNFSMIPILRKLLKVFEFLAERKILTLDHINGDPRRPGLESFRDSILTLTEHEDRKVHQIARNFRDRWIPRPYKKFNCMEKYDQNMEFNRASSCSRFSGSRRHHWRGHLERPLETMDYMQQSPPSSHVIDSDDMLEGSSTHATECVTNIRRDRKRKSRWDQPSEPVSLRCSQEQKAEPGSSLKFDLGLQPRIDLAGASCMPQRGGEQAFNYHHTYYDQTQGCREDEECQEMEEDAPPGFSCPSIGGSQLSKTACSSLISISQQYPGPLKCPSEVHLGYPQERYNSHLPVAYGIPLNVVQEFGTPLAATADGWVIAPGRPFHPFPPLPPHPREQGKKEGRPSASSNLTMNASAGRSQDSHLPASNHINQDSPSVSNARLLNTVPATDPQRQHERGPYSHERRYFKPRQNNSTKSSWGVNWNTCGFDGNYSRTGPPVP